MLIRMKKPVRRHIILPISEWRREQLSNREVYHEKELPVTLDVPVKEGYNFAGWYTDSSYTKKVTEITRKVLLNLFFCKMDKDNRQLSER